MEFLLQKTKSHTAVVARGVKSRCRYCFAQLRPPLQTVVKREQLVNRLFHLSEWESDVQNSKAGG